eukprot:SAG31_NODE_9972_length_1202_cov_1.668178_1_plen_208_part_00
MLPPPPPPPLLLLLLLLCSLGSAAVTIAERRAPPPVRAFLGQRYAEPPLGARRFAPATVKAFNDSSLEPGGSKKAAGTKGSRCTQSSGGGEDCLFANIYAPLASLPKDAGGQGGDPVPVFFWIHGGGWTAGSGNDYDGAVLAAGQNIVVVAINYRLGALGFFASPELAAAPGNHNATGGMNGILDMIVALKVRQSAWESSISTEKIR